jgi:hypothetical protein
LLGLQAMQIIGDAVRLGGDGKTKRLLLFRTSSHALK